MFRFYWLIAIATGLSAHQSTIAAIQLQSMTGASSPMAVRPARDGSNRLFVVEQSGYIRVLQPGATGTTLFLDIHTRVAAGGERGLLGLAFHPKYAINGRFFVYYTRVSDGALRIAEYHVSAGDPNVADTTELNLLTIPHPGQSNHNGGDLDFGPDGFLYIGTGDGGSGNDPPNNAQNINALLGKFLRIDVDHPNGDVPYSSPPDNPFFGATPGADEIYAYGMRNPWRWSFDRGGTHQLYCGDVGQNLYEEIDLIERGKNYGWRVYEGFHCTNNDPSLCTTPNPYTLPLAEYGHSGGRCSITGGYIYRGYRGTIPTGAYIYADYCTGEIFEFNPPTTGGAQTLLLDSSHNISSFGQDEAGDIYLCALGGTVYRVAPAVTPVACSYSIGAPTSVSVGSGGATLSLTINVGATCGWTVASHANWITLTDPTNYGVGTQAIGYTVAPNPGAARTGNVKVGGQTLTVTQAAAPFVTAWRSVRTHAGAGDLSIALDPAATGTGLSGPTLEPRSDGIQRIEVDFSGAVTLADPSQVQVTGYTTSGGVVGPAVSYTPASVSSVDADTIAIVFPAAPSAGVLPDESCVVVQLLGGLTGEALTGDADVAVRSLAGDTTGSGDITLSDALYTMVQIGTAVGVGPRFDVDLSGGVIELADALISKSQVASPPRRALCP